MFVFGCPMEVCFNSAEYSNVVIIDVTACMDPLTPVVVCVNSSCVLECYSEGCGKAKRWMRKVREKMWLGYGCG